MNINEAREIVRAINSIAFSTMGIGEPDARTLDGVSLADMATAAAFVRAHDNAKESNADGSRSVQVIPDMLIRLTHTAPSCRVESSGASAL